MLRNGKRCLGVLAQFSFFFRAVVVLVRGDWAIEFSVSVRRDGHGNGQLFPAGFRLKFNGTGSGARLLLRCILLLLPLLLLLL